MKVSATVIKNNLGKYLRDCKSEDVYITKNDKIVAVLSSFDGSEDGLLLIKEGNAAYNYSRKKVSFEEFLKIAEGNEERYEYIDGEVFLLYSPGFTHQSVSSNLNKKFLSWFEGKKCRVFSAPFDIILYNEETKSKCVVQPDLMVICDHDKGKIDNDRYTGIPTLVIEILSPQTRSRDFVKKLNVYLQGGVREYWVVDPKQKQIVQYYFVEKKLDQVLTYKSPEIVKSQHFNGLDIAVAEILETL